MAKATTTTETTKAYVRIQSEMNINVTMGLQNKNFTNPDAHIPDRLKVSALWPRANVMILQGAHWYPSEIASWSSVKALAKDKVLTIGEFSDTCDEPEVDTKKQKLETEVARIAKETGVSLDALVEE